MDRPFLDGAGAPTEAALRAALAGAYPRYEDLLRLAGRFGRAWTFSRTGGWMLKVYDGKKALFYVIPLAGGFRVSLAIREAERAALLRDGELQTMNAALASAKKWAEGFALEFEVSEPGADGGPDSLDAFVGKLIAVRAANGMP
jgi:hypothetical protein